jgi:hypothetical protein
MFDENFSFDASRSPSLDSSNAPSTRDTSRSVSPCSAVGPFPPPPATFSVADLAAQFADSRIRQDSRVYNDPCEAYAAMDDDAGWVIEPATEVDIAIAPLAKSSTFPQRAPRQHSPSHRIQRQANARLLCTSSHRQEVAALVARMVQTQEQCSVASSESGSPISTIAEDEGYDSSDGATPVQSRRSSIVPGVRRMESRRPSEAKVNACVSKSIRFHRREKSLARVRSSDR